MASVDKAVVKCLRVEEKSFVAKNKMNGSRIQRLLWYGISHIPIVIPLYYSSLDARLGDTFKTDPRIS